MEIFNQLLYLGNCYSEVAQVALNAPSFLVVVLQTEVALEATVTEVNDILLRFISVRMLVLCKPIETYFK